MIPEKEPDIAEIGSLVRRMKEHRREKLCASKVKADKKVNIK